MKSSGVAGGHWAAININLQRERKYKKDNLLVLFLFLLVRLYPAIQCPQTQREYTRPMRRLNYINGSGEATPFDKTGLLRRA